VLETSCKLILASSYQRDLVKEIYTSAVGTMPRAGSLYSGGSNSREEMERNVEIVFRYPTIIDGTW
jgi:hypothetical protein